MKEAQMRHRNNNAYAYRLFIRGILYAYCVGKCACVGMEMSKKIFNNFRKSIIIRARRYQNICFVWCNLFRAFFSISLPFFLLPFINVLRIDGNGIQKVFLIGCTMFSIYFVSDKCPKYHFIGSNKCKWMVFETDRTETIQFDARTIRSNWISFLIEKLSRFAVMATFYVQSRIWCRLSVRNASGKTKWPWSKVFCYMTNK